ncbi:hypothetical protein Kpol_499p27 [Vanderwaltozyma polyspora DSM 70294]|uniref:CAP-Gly domain-containing protein n=1 Tax=Vanderwaltozyma polyspora (strain ATCC 22028 / DSM 70294 / BCRC 21397 / CBS 2163 / NBRC 10782 / NRRL Y-8283 / UCD 57-17) TaxID=436907 RepID=A7TP30_VANPO|nr:uncharacterized protein Kpol_499p27 [Vanderwaltozyma polyspora DSM 70294]EDO15999.1 hypothetical protein Kpol_499p27 [Vanderwaltozyma polyspora DSM 70294]
MYTVGSRLCISDELCTIRYVGEIDAWPGIVAYGVEWDNTSRGKHSGTVGGRRYFRTEVANSGSFIKESKFLDSVQPAQSFVTALKARYGDILNDVGNFKLGTKKVESFGFEKLGIRNREFRELKRVSLSRCKVGDRLEENEQDNIKQLAVNIIDLDLSYNLLSNFRETIRLLQCIEKVEILDLTGNIFTSGWEICDKSKVEIKNVRHLNMGSCRLTSQNLRTIFAVFPNLETLNLNSNCLSDISKINIKLPDSLQELNISGNSIDSLSPNFVNWRLKTIKISHNLFTSTDKMLRNEFIEELDISHNYLKNWEDLDTLNVGFPRLKSLRIGNNPLSDAIDSSESVFYETISRFDKVSTLNGSTIDKPLREEAETYFMTKVSSGETYYDRSLVRYKRLENRYGLKCSPQKRINSWLDDNLIKLTVLEPESGEKMSVCILRTWSVRYVKSIICNHLNSSILDTELFVPRGLTKVDLLDRDFSPISDYQLDDNDELCIKLTSDGVK